MFKAKIVVDGANEAEVSGTDKTTVLSQAALYFSQYAQDFEYEIRLELTNDK